MAVLNHKRECARLLLMEVKMKCNIGFTALMCAAQEGDEDLVHSLRNHEMKM